MTDELVERMARAIIANTCWLLVEEAEQIANAALAALRKTHHLVPRATGDDGELEQAAKVVADEIAHLRFGTRKTDTPERQARRLRRFEAALKSMEQAADRITALRAEVERLKADGRLLINDCDCIGMKSPMLENFRQALGAKP